ncbi:hypothetical protein [Tomitella biformata]|uniref:hypothetical protein n=1 Tax=Tomitella biformata TaxID=630403 RepID=UPI000464BD6F|nr:hypothetical protein [Tomitella biformata]
MTGFIEDAEANRARVLAHVRAWCDGATIDGARRDLSDSAAVLIAAGRLEPSMRHILLARCRAGVGVPSVGGFAQVREMAERLDRTEKMMRGLERGARLMALSLRAEDLRRRLHAVRSRVVGSAVIYPGGVRGVRRERREGVHLTVAQRTELFGMLCWTPVPQPDGRGYVVSVGSAAIADVASAAAARVDRLGEGSSSAAALRRVESWGRPVAPDGTGPLHFNDRYETLLYLAGVYFDHITVSPTWLSPVFDMQRIQVDLGAEVVALSVDTAELQQLYRALAHTASSTTSLDVRLQVEQRTRVLDGVWDQLVERVASLARIFGALGNVERHLGEARAADQARNLDHRIDELVGRSGGHEMATENLYRIGEEVEIGGFSYAPYQSLVAREIAELTAARG